MYPRGTALASCLFELFLVTLPATSTVIAQAPPARQTTTSAVKPQEASAGQAARYADEPYVVERHFETVRFENDGTQERELSVRVRVQSEAGAQQFRELAFGYIFPNEQIAVRSATIRRPDGSSVNVLAAPNTAKETTPTITRDFPAYTNFKELRVAVPSLKAGDMLEYEVVTRVVKPFAPGHFWFQYDFVRDAIALDERLELSLPGAREFSIKAPDFVRVGGKERTGAAKLAGIDFIFTRAEEGGRTILRWKHANLKIASDGNEASLERSSIPPDVQLTSFENWGTLARWFSQLEKGQAEPTARIRAKTRELIRGATNEIEKAQALCDYVSKKIQYVNLPADFGRLPPRSAEAVLADGYGDSGDKRALLAAMLNAAGIHSDSVLIAYREKLDPEFPSPAQFGRVITSARLGEKVIWIDSSDELVPFGFLPAPLRGKSALSIDTDGTGRIVETPADPPFLSTQKVNIEGQITELGKLSGTIQYSLRGDTEFVLRTAFHRAPQTQWNQLAQTILTLDGLRGTVTNVTTSDPLDTEKPFQLTIAFSDPSAFDWPMERAKIALPLLTIAMPDAPTERGQPVKLGTPLDVETHLRLRFPPNFTVHPPVGIAAARDYAEFKSSYRFENGELIAERTLNFKAHELPASGVPDYLAFAHAVQADEAQTVFIENPTGGRAEIPANARPDDVFDAGAAALKAGNTRGAVLLLQRAVQLQPEHKRAWNDLGLAYMQARKFTEAAAAFQKQTKVNPPDEHAHDYLGIALEELQRNDDAADAFRKQIAIQPLDPIAHAQLGNILLAQRRYSDAVPELEKAGVLSPGNAELQIRLGRAYLNIGDKDKALAAFRKGAALSPSPEIRNEAAFALAELGTDLDEAQRYAEAAVRSTAANLEKADLAHLTPAELAQTRNIGNYWDTLGWVHFRKGDFARAERYIRAAWLLDQDGEVGDHLAQVYAKSGEKDRAIQQCALALAGFGPVPDTRARLMLLLGGNTEIGDLVTKARPELEKMRTFPVNLPVKQNASADFLIVMSPGKAESLSTRIEAVRFAGGDESLQQFGNVLKSVDYGEIFPDPTPVKLIRRGTLSCSSAASTCKFTLQLPEDTRAAN
jgi:Flp pilus assembly protein TadD/transglutaminase-like putative cysteine protease